MYFFMVVFFWISVALVTQSGIFLIVEYVHESQKRVVISVKTIYNVKFQLAAFSLTVKNPVWTST